MERTPDLSVVIMPRERFSGLEDCIRSLAIATDEDTEFVIVDQGFSRKALERARQVVAPREFRVVHDGTFLSEGAARNIGLAAARAPAWVLLVDGEMTVAPDTVRWLRKAAEETGAAITVPLLLEREGLIHTTGGQFTWPEENGGKLDQADANYLAWCPAEHDIPRSEIEMVETHLMLIDRDQTGDEPFEWKHIHLFHFDISLTALRNKWTVIMEPRARALFKRPPPISWEDYQLFSKRWNRDRFREDSRFFEEKWGYDIHTKDLVDWEKFALSISLFPERLRNPVTQRISNAAYWLNDALRTNQRALKMRGEGGLLRLTSQGAPDETLAKVCVIVASKNRPEDLRRSIESILANDYPNFEIVCVEQGLTTATPMNVTNAHHHRFRRFMQAGTGKAFALNAALAQTDARLLLFTDDDCTVPSDWVATAVRMANEHRAAAAFFGRVDAIPHDQTTDFVPAYTPERSKVHRGFTRRSRAAFPMMGANMAIRTDALRSVGNFDVAMSPGGTYGTAEDTDVAIRLLRAGYSVMESTDLRVTHWGVRSFAAGQVRELYIRTCEALGAMYARHLRQGDAMALVSLAAIVLHDCAEIAKATLKRQRPLGLRRLAAYPRGFVRGLRGYSRQPRSAEFPPLVLVEDSFHTPAAEPITASAAS